MQQNPNPNSNYPSNPSQFSSQPSSSLQPGTGQGFSVSPSGFALGQYLKSQAQSQPQPDPNLSQANPSSYPSQTQNPNANYQQPTSLPQQNLPVPQSNQPNNYMEQSFSPQQHLQNLQNSQAYLQHSSNNPQQNLNNYQNNPQQNLNNYSNNPQMNPPMNNNPSQKSNNYQQNANTYSNNPPQNTNNYPNNPPVNIQNPNIYSQTIPNNQALPTNNPSYNPNNSQAYPPSNTQNPQQGNYNTAASQNIGSQNPTYVNPESALPQQVKQQESAKPKPMEQEQKAAAGGGLEEIPDFLPFVDPNSLKSPIPYPKDLAKIEGGGGGQILQSKYSFTPNTNAFYVIEEERNTAVLKSEAMKPHMIYKESLISEWVDDELPHDITCVTRDPARQEIFRAVSWKKLSEVAPEDGFAIIYDTNRPQELITGLLNDRALQSALAVLAENEDFFPYIFPEFNESSHTISCLWLNHTGEWKIYVLDEYYPFVVNAKSSPPAFTSTKNETWVLIIEKAFAKMYGGYLALEKGHPAHYVHDLTGAPYRYFYYENPVDCWQYLMANYKTATVVAMNKDPRYRIDDENDLSKEPSFCYAVINIQEINFGRNVERIVKLRNPWKEIAWNGDWSPQSNRWTQELMQKLNPEGATNDYFWIGINDFVKYFGMGFSFSINQKFQHSSLKFRQSYQRNSTLILMNVDTAGTTSIQISQMDARHFPQGNNKYTYSLVKMMIMEVDGNLQGKRFVTGIYDKGRDCEIETFLEAGDYMIYVEIDWEQTLAREATISNVTISLFINS